jgi:hypothetical protein
MNGRTKLSRTAVFPFECSRREVEYDVIRIVGENLVFIGAFPGIEVFLDKRADVFLAPLG